MFDFVLGIGLAALALRGWVRGFVREVIDLVSLVLGIVVAFWLSAPLGNFLSDQFGVSSEVARIGSGILLFVLFGVAMGLAAHFLSRLMSLPGLNLMNRIGGVAVAVGWGIALMLVIVNVARALPLSDDLDRQLDESVVIEAVVGEESIPQAVFARIAGDGVLGPLRQLQGLFGSTRIVPASNEVVAVPPAPADELRLAREDLVLVLERLNESRTGRELGALFASSALTAVSENRGINMYLEGRISRDTPPGGSVTDDIAAAGVLLEVDGEVLGLAATSRAVTDAILDSEEASALIHSAQYDRVGLALVDGPTGVLLVLILGG